MDHFRGLHSQEWRKHTTHMKQKQMSSSSGRHWSWVDNITIHKSIQIHPWMVMNVMNVSYVSYVCMYVSIYLSMYLSIYLSMYLCIYVSMYLCIYVSMCLCVYVSMYLCIYVSMYLCIYVSMYVWMYVWMSVMCVCQLCMYVCVKRKFPLKMS